MLKEISNIPIECLRSIEKRGNRYYCQSGERLYCLYGTEIDKDIYEVYIPKEVRKLAKMKSVAFRYYCAPDCFVKNGAIGSEGETWIFRTVKQLCQRLLYNYYSISRLELDLFTSRVFSTNEALRKLTEEFEKAREETDNEHGQTHPKTSLKHKPVEVKIEVAILSVGKKASYS